VQQPGQFGFGGESERGGEFSGKRGDIAQMGGERLPLARRFWERFPVFTCRSMRVVFHRIHFKIELWTVLSGKWFGDKPNLFIFRFAVIQHQIHAGENKSYGLSTSNPKFIPSPGP
jgi:hypothetical protein